MANNQEIPYIEQGVLEDEGPAGIFQKYRDELSRRAEFVTESITVDPQRLVESAITGFNRHRRGIAKLGSLGVGALGLGVAAGAVVATHRR